MAIIHIQEVNSNQVTEVIANTIQQAIKVYAENAAFNWSELHNYFMWYHNHDSANGIERAVFYFRTEKLVIRNIYGNRYTAEWKDL